MTVSNTQSVEDAAWREREALAKRAFVDFVRERLGRELGYEDWQQAGLKDVFDFVDIPAGGRWIAYQSQTAGKPVIGGKVFNSEGLLVNQFEFALETV